MRQQSVWLKDYITENSGFIITEENEEILALFVAPNDPDCFENAVQEEVWRKEMEAEIESIEKNNTWELVELPEGAKVIGVKWIFKTKLNEKGEIDKFKARLVAKEEGNILIVSLYVDDLIYIGSSMMMVERFKNSMMNEFSMNDLGTMKFFLGVEVVQDGEGIFIGQRKNAEETIKKYGMENCNSVRNSIVPGQKLTKAGSGEAVDSTEFKQLIGSLRYLTATRPDLIYSVNLVSRYMESPNEQNMLAAKRILRYVQGMQQLGIRYRCGGQQKLIGFVDSDYAGDVDDRRSTSGYVFMFGDGAVSWASKKQPIVTLSTTEAEFVSAAYGACQAVWLINVLKEIGCDQEEGTIMLCDNSSTIKLSKNPILHRRSKHIHVRYHFLRELVNEGTIQLDYCATQV